MDAVFVRPDPDEASVYLGMDPGPQDELREHYRQRVAERGKRATARVRRKFNAVCKKHDIPRVRGADVPGTASARLLVAQGEVSREVTEAAKLCDVVVFAGSSASLDGLLPNVLKSVLLHSGAALLCCPSGPAGYPLRRIAIAWDGSVYAVRAIRAAEDLLRAAEAICIISVERDYEESKDPRKVVEYLAWRGLTSEFRTVQCHHEEVGGTLDVRYACPPGTRGWVLGEPVISMMGNPRRRKLVA